jgi:hypothetical protein
MEQNNIKQSYVEKSGVKAMPWSTFFSRTTSIPLDRSSMFGSIEDAQKYAKGDKTNPDSRGLFSMSYVGQIITVFENDEVTVYKINSNRDLEVVGGKGTVVVTSVEDAQSISSKENSIGQIILVTNNENKEIYMVTEINKIIKLFEIKNNDEIILDAGTF